MILDHLLIIH